VEKRTAAARTMSRSRPDAEVVAVVMEGAS